MSTKLKAGTATSGAVIDADTAGILELQSGSTPTTAITIDASQGVNTSTNTYLATTAGNVGIGTTTPSTKLNIYGSSPSIYLEQNTGVAGNTQIRLNAAGGANTASVRIQDKYIWNSTANGSLLNFGADLTTPQMQLDSSGRLLMGCTSVPSTTVGGVLLGNQSSAEGFISSTGSYTGGSDRCLFINGNGTVGKISVSGSTTTYATSSDYRLKENVSPMANALDRVSALKPVTYTWKADGSNGEGFIAHELQEVCPDAVIGEKDAVNEDGSIKAQSIDTSFLVATLVAAIQELKAEVDALKGAK